MACCGEPLRCCGEKPGSKDGWYCGCACLNGAPQISVALVLVFAGFCFSLFTLGDCRFAEIDGGFIPVSTRLPWNNDEATELRRGVGFVTFEKPGGGCYYYNDYSVSQEELARLYVDFLGSDWNAGRIMAVMTPIISLLTWIYLWSFVCTSQVRACRYTVAFVLCVVLSTLQGVTFTALTSRWCDDNACELSRSSGLSIGALLCFFFAGLALLFSSNYPGVADLPAAVASKGEVVQEDEEDPEQAVVEEEDKDKDAEKVEQAPEEQAPPDDASADQEESKEGSEGNIEVLDDVVVEASMEMEA